MDDWMDTVCQILASDIGVRPCVARFMMNDWMQRAYEAYNEGYSARGFAEELREMLFGSY